VKKIISIGEATVDSFLFLSEANVHCNLNHQKCELCLKYAEKVLADKMSFSVGGNAANTAVSFARLGLTSQIYCIVGDDWLGDKVQKVLEGEGVNCQYLSKEKGDTSYASVLVYQGERTLIVYHVPRRYLLPRLENVDWIYLTSMGKNYQNAYEKVLMHIKKTGARLAFNPGSHQLRDGIHKLRPYLKLSELLFVNLQEARALTELKSSSSVRHICEELYDYGPKIISITDGENGAYCFDGHQLIHQQIVPGKVVETTGAGDAYASAFTAAVFYTEPLEEAMRWGMANSASVIEKVGAQEGLLTRSQIVDCLSDHPCRSTKVVR
jgi:ribokinase